MGTPWKVARPLRVSLRDRQQVVLPVNLRASDSTLLDVLLEPRTLSRGQIREEPVRRLISGTISGRQSRTHVLGVLLTLELFQRQFVDGDGLRE